MNDTEILNLQFTDVYKLKKLNVEQCEKVMFTLVPTVIQVLNANNCKLTSKRLEGIFEMTQIVELDLSNNNLTVVSELSALEKLKRLFIG